MKPDALERRQPRNSLALISNSLASALWYPWGEEAFARARREDKPIFLSVGYSTCHWCHVMERETFGGRGQTIVSFTFRA